MEQSLTKEFGFFRSFLWPIHRHEFRKFIPLFVILFLICFNYGILRPMKDTLIITAAGAKVLPYIKVWGILPIAILLTYFFTKLTHYFSQEKTFYIITSSFIGFFLLFAFVLYPLRDVLHPHQSADYLQTIFPNKGLAGLIDLYRYWTLSLFYVIAELWSSIVLSTLFWGVANEVTPINQAKRFYGVFGIASNLAALVSGFTANMLGFAVKGSWNSMVSIFILTVTAGGLIVMLLFRWQSKTILTEKSYPNLHSVTAKSFKKKKPSLKESFQLLSQSKYLSYIAALVVSYNLVINLMDVVWKDRLHLYCSSPQELNYYMNNVTSAVGLLSLLITFFIPKIIERFGWTKTALITPIAMGLTGAGFFCFLVFGSSFQGLTSIIMTPLAIAVFFGSLQHCLSKAVKYSLFDTTQNMAFIPLPHDLKYKGKAPIDVIGARFGKSGGSLIYQGLLLFVGTISACIPYIAVLFIAMITFWTTSTRRLGKMFNALVQEQQQSNVEASPETTAASAPQTVA